MTNGSHDGVRRGLARCGEASLVAAGRARRDMARLGRVGLGLARRGGARCGRQVPARLGKAWLVRAGLGSAWRGRQRQLEAAS